MTALPPLDGIRVIDLSRVLAGPYCTALLSDAGADVVKIESEHGEDSRHLGPFRDGESIYFNVLNRGKRSVALNLKNDEDREALLTLIETADVALMGEDLRHLPHTLTHARRARSIMLQNVGLSLVLIAILIPLAALGVLGLAAVVLVHEVAEIFVIGNGVRAGRVRPLPPAPTATPTAATVPAKAGAR